MKYNINDLKIIVNDKILDDIRKYYCLNTNYETGGILLGKFNKENRVVEITEVHELKTNFFSRILYKRSGRKAQKIINRRSLSLAAAICLFTMFCIYPFQRIPVFTV